MKISEDKPVQNLKVIRSVFKDMPTSKLVFLFENLAEVTVIVVTSWERNDNKAEKMKNPK